MDTNVMTKRKVELEDMAQRINRMLGNISPKTENHVCMDCEFDGPHTVELYLADIDKALPQYKCTKCGCVWIYND